MRAALPSLLVLSLLLGACSGPEPRRATPITQSGPLLVHPGLLGQPVPPELQTPEERNPNAVARVDVAGGGTPGVLDKGGTLRLDEAGLRTQRSVYFELNEAAIKADFDPMLQAHARYLAQHPEARVRIEGNADERGSLEHNQRLGQRRAEAVRQALVERGGRDKQVRVVSLGESRPKLKGHDESSWSENRRADIVYEKEK